MRIEFRYSSRKLFESLSKCNCKAPLKVLVLLEWYLKSETLRSFEW